MFKKILVPYDGSAPSDKALQQAVSIVKSLGNNKADVIVLHVIAEYPTHHFIERPARSIKTGEKTTLSEYLKEVYEMMAESAADALAKKKQEIRKSSGLEIETRVMAADNISDTIIKIAEKEGVDLIVIGNVGRSGMSRLRTLGSVSRGVSERASCPVMIIH
jgi:nucleotide-binding universal stress UspA family protein